MPETLTRTLPSLSAELRARVAGAQSSLASRGVAGLLIYVNGETPAAGSVRYLTGWVPTRESVCWVPVTGAPQLVCADKNAARAWALVCSDTADVHKVAQLIDGLRQVLAGAGAHSGVAIGSDGFRDATRSRRRDLEGALSGCDVQDVSDLLPQLRSQPTAFEADRIRAATLVADAMVQRCMEIAATPGVRGRDLMVETEYLGRQLGAEEASCWIATGARPAETYMQLFELDDLVDRSGRVQIGTTVRVDGYYSQVLRIGMFAQPDPRMQSVADALIEMQNAALGAMIPGEPSSVVGDRLEAMIDSLCPYTRANDPFRFQSCHAMGNSYVEPWAEPYLFVDRDHAIDRDAVPLRPNQAYEIHPNFSLPELGHVCAGDVALVTEEGATWVSTTPRGIIPLG